MIDYEPFFSIVGHRLRESAIRAMSAVAQIPDIISFAPGFPAPEMFAWDEFREIAAELLSGRDGLALQYGPTRGFGPLVGAVQEILDARGVKAERADLLITTGSQQGLDLVARVLADPGDVVLVELPTYVGAIVSFRNAQARLAGVRQQPDGIDLDELDATVARERAGGRRVRVLYLVPNFQNPTGLLISQDKRRALLARAARHDLLIVEDDPYTDLYFDEGSGAIQVRPIKADDEEGRVIYLSSFSKTLAPGYRVGWVAAPAPVAAKLELAKQGADLCTGVFDQRMVYEAWTRGVLERGKPRLRSYYRDKCAAMAEALRENLTDVLRWQPPRGGFFIWGTLPQTLDAGALLQQAIARRVIYVAGSAFFVDGQGANTLRLSFSQPSPQQIREGIGRLAGVLREALEEDSVRAR